MMNEDSASIYSEEALGVSSMFQESTYQPLM